MKVIDNTKKAIKSIYNNLSKLFSLKGNQEELDNLHKTINTITFVLTTIIFIISVFTICFGLSSVLSKNESKLRYIEEDGIRYIELVDGYIKEELVVETGTILPDLKSYFRDDYELPDNISAQYFENNNALNLEQFTYKVNGDYYLKGIRTINVTIFGDYEYETKLSIVDTTSPTVTLQDVSIPADETLDLKKFVKTYTDNSQINDYTINFKEDYDLTKEGTQNVTLVVCDVSDNCNEGTAKLTITKPLNLIVLVVQQNLVQVILQVAIRNLVQVVVQKEIVVHLIRNQKHYIHLMRQKLSLQPIVVVKLKVKKKIIII